MLHTFTPKKSYAYMLNVKPRNLVFLKTYNTEFDEIIITLTNQNSEPLEIEDKVNLISLFYRIRNRIFVIRKSVQQIWKK